MERSQPQFGFHDKSSRLIRKLDNGLRAKKKNPDDFYGDGLAYSALPLTNEAEFEVAITSYGGTKWDGSLKIGIALFKGEPGSFGGRIPKVSTESSDHLVWSSDKVYNRLRNTNKYGSVNLESLREGGRVGLRLTKEGTLTFYVNDESQGVAEENVYETGCVVYAVVDHYGNCSSTTITKAGIAMRAIASYGHDNYSL